METRQGISFYILGTWLVGDFEIEPGKEEGPAGLAWVESFGIS